MIALNFPLDHTHPRRSIDFPEFQTQPRTRHSSYSLSTRVPNQSSIPCLESHFHKPLLLLSFPGYAARVLESADMKNHLFFFHSGQLGKAWAPTLGLWGIGAGTAAVFVRAFESHCPQYHV